MNKMNILIYPNPFLKTVAEKVENFGDSALQETIDKMIETMYDNGGVGLAATQIGIKDAIIIYDLSISKSEPEVLINPEILATSPDKYKMTEGCLSFPGMFFPVIRPYKIWLTGYRRNGIKVKFELEGKESSILQHEIDHLNGILFIDRLSKAQKSVYMTKLKKFRKLMKKHGHRQ